MPRPTLRRTVSSPAVRQRSSSNPYPYPPTSPMTTRSMAAALSLFGPSTSAQPTPTPSVATTRSRRVNSTSSSAAAESSWSRRVLADITWCYDGQVASGSADPNDDDTGLGNSLDVVGGDNFDLEDMERLSLGVPGPGSIVEEDETFPSSDAQDEEDILFPLRVGTPEPSEDPFALLTDIDSQPSSTNSSPAQRPGVTRSISLGHGMGIQFALCRGDPDPVATLHSRREASYSSISTCSEFEDFVPSPSYV